MGANIKIVSGSGLGEELTLGEGDACFSWKFSQAGLEVDVGDRVAAEVIVLSGQFRLT